MEQKDMKWKWLMSQDGSIFKYRMICPVCGYSYRVNDREIIVRERCDECGIKLADRKRTLRLTGTGQLIEQESDDEGDGSADDQHQHIVAEMKQARPSIIRKIRKVIHAGGREFH